MTNKTYASTIIGLKHTGRSFTSGVGNSGYRTKIEDTQNYDLIIHFVINLFIEDDNQDLKVYHYQ